MEMVNYHTSQLGLALSGGEIVALFLTNTRTSQPVLLVLVTPFLYGMTNGMTIQ